MWTSNTFSVCLWKSLNKMKWDVHAEAVKPVCVSVLVEAWALTWSVCCDSAVILLCVWLSKLLRSSHDPHGFSSHTHSHSHQLPSVKSADCPDRGHWPHISIIHVSENCVTTLQRKLMFMLVLKMCEITFSDTWVCSESNTVVLILNTV